MMSGCNQIRMGHVLSIHPCIGGSTYLRHRYFACDTRVAVLRIRIPDPWGIRAKDGLVYGNDCRVTRRCSHVLRQFTNVGVEVSSGRSAR